MSVTLDPIMGVADAIRSRLAQPDRTRRWATPGDLARALDPTTVQTPALDVIDRELVALADGHSDRLMVFMPPQEGKSVRTSQRFVEWLLHRDPDLRVAIVSYADEMARRWGSDIKLDVETFNGDDGTIDLGLRLRADSRAAGRWQIDGHKGGVYCVGVGGALTGKPVDCLRGDSLILTELGYARIDEIHGNGAPFPRVLSCNHKAARTEWRRINATRAIADRPLVEVHTASGRVLRCTPDHRIHTAERGYVPAADLQPGERVLAARIGADQMRELSGRVHQAPLLRAEDDPRHLDVLLSGVPDSRVAGDADLRGLRRDVHQAALRGGESQTERLRSDVLHEGLLPCDRVRSGASADLGRGMRRAVPAGDRRDAARTVGAAPVLRRGRQRPGRRRQSVASLPRLRQGPQVQRPDVQDLLHGGASLDLPPRAVLAMRYGVPAHASRGRKEKTSWSSRAVLLRCVPPRVHAHRWTPLPSLRDADGITRSTSALLLPGVPEGGAAAEEDQAVRALRRGVRVLKSATGVLHAQLRERRALIADGRSGKLALQGRHQLRGLVPEDASTHPGAGPEAVPGVRAAELPDADRADDAAAAEVGAVDSPSQRGSGGQSAGESDHAVCDLPCGAPQVEYDTVSVVRHLHGVRDTVYDLQVDGNRNFFADQVLVHNCLIIDDPIKDMEQAQSAAYRARAQRFWQAVAVPRLGPGARCVLIQTRWNEADLGGWLLANEPGRWRVVSIPAIAEADNDPLGRRPGEAMVSARGHRDWAGIRASVGEYVWAALYQQRPAPAEGGLFKRKSLRYWTPMPADSSRHGTAGGRRLDLGGRVVYLDDCWRFLTADLAASTRTSADYTAAGAWAISPDGDLILLEVRRARIEETGHWDLIRPLREQWAADVVYVESRMFGTTMVIDATRAGVPVAELKADTDKITRAIPATARADTGRLWLPAGDGSADVVDELLAFPNGSHDDFVDVVAYAARVQAAHWLPQETVEQEQARRDSGRANDGAIAQAFTAATGTASNGTDFMSLNY